MQPYGFMLLSIIGVMSGLIIVISSKKRYDRMFGWAIVVVSLVFSCDLFCSQGGCFLPPKWVEIYHQIIDFLINLF